jgi:hypothetical protein
MVLQVLPRGHGMFRMQPSGDPSAFGGALAGSASWAAWPRRPRWRTHRNPRPGTEVADVQHYFTGNPGKPVVDGQVEVPAGGHEKSPPQGLGQRAIGRPPPRARASFMRNDSPSVATKGTQTVIA